MSNERVKEILEQAWEVKQGKSYSLAQRYYNMVLEIEPTNWEAKMYISIIDKMQISCGETDFALRAISNSLSSIARNIAYNVTDRELRAFYCLDIAGDVSRFAFYVFDLQCAEYDRLVMERTRFNKWAPIKFSKEYMQPRCKALSRILYKFADDLRIQFPEGEGVESVKMLRSVGKTMLECSR